MKLAAKILARCLVTAALLVVGGLIVPTHLLGEGNGPVWQASLSFKANVVRGSGGTGEPIYFEGMLGSAFVDYNGMNNGQTARVETLLTLDTPYTISCLGEWWSSATFYFSPPQGYRVRANGQEVLSVTLSSANPYQDIVLEADEPVRGTPFDAWFPTAGNFLWTLPLGTLPDKVSAGAVRITKDTLDSVFTPAALKYVTPASTSVDVRWSGSVMRQIYTVDWLIDIVTAGISNGYEIRCYLPGSFSTTKDGQGFYPVNGGATPAVTYALQNVSGTGETRLQLKRTRGARVDTVQIAHQAGDANWSAYVAYGVGAAYNIKTEGTTYVGQETKRTWEEKDSAGTVLKRTEETYRNIGTDLNGAPRIQLTKAVGDPGAGGKNYTAEMDYYSNPGISSTFGRLFWSKNPNGGWTRYDYWDDTTDKRGLVKTTYEPWLDAPLTPLDAGYATGLKTSYDYYYGSIISMNGRPSLIERSLNGTTISKAQISYSQTTINSVSVITITTTSSHGSGVGETLTTTRKIFDPNTPGYERWKIRDYSVDFPGGKRAVNCNIYWAGYDPATGAFSGPGRFSRNAILTGTIAASGSGRLVRNTLFGPVTYRVDDLYIYPNESTLEIEINDLEGRTVRKELWVYVGTGTSDTVSFSDFELVSWEKTGHDVEGNVTSWQNSKGEQYSATYVDGQIQSETLKDGRIRSYAYDLVGRIETETVSSAPASGVLPAIPALATKRVHDLYRRLKRVEISNGTETIYSEKLYDLGGRLVEERSPEGVIAKHVPDKLSPTDAHYPMVRNQVVQRVSGVDTVLSEVVTTTFRDGRVKSVTGNGAVNSFNDYSVLTSPAGYLKTTERQGSSTSPRIKETVTDWMGKARTVASPALAGGMLVTTFEYDSASGFLKRVVSPGLKAQCYSYDKFGALAVDWLDVNANQLADIASADRITEHQSRLIKDGTDWWLQEQSFTYPSAGSGSRLLLNRTRTRLSGFSANLVSEQKVWGGNPVPTPNDWSELTGAPPFARNAVYQNRTARTIESRQFATGVTSESVDTAYNGLPVRSVTTSGQITDSLYDSLHRLSSSILRTGNSDSNLGPVDVETQYVYEAGTPRLWKKSEKNQSGTFITTAEYGYWPSGLLSWEKNAAAKASRYEYTPAGQLAYAWGDADYPSKHVYDAYGQQTQLVTYRTGTWTSTTRPTSFTSLTGDVTTWVYDEPTGLQLNKRDALHTVGDPRQVSFAYDAYNRIQTRTGATGKVTTYAYHPDTGELTGQTYSDGTPAIGFQYGRLGEVTQVTDATGTRQFSRRYTVDLQSECEQLDGSFYTPNLRLKQLYNGTTRLAEGFRLGTATACDAAFTDTVLEVNHGFNAGNGRLDSVTVKPRNAAYSHVFSYAYLGNTLISRSLCVPTGTGGSTSSFVQTRQYEPYRPLLKAFENRAGTGSPTPSYAKYAYQRDTLGRVLDETQTGLAFGNYGNGTGLKVAYAHNDRDELTQASTTDPSGTVAFPDRYYSQAYDHAGNRTLGHRYEEDHDYEESFTANALNQYGNRSTVKRFGQIRGAAPTTTSVTTLFNGTTGTPTRPGAGQYYHQEVSQGSGTTAVNVPATIKHNGAAVATQNLLFRPSSETMTFDKDGNLTQDAVFNYTYDAENRLVSVAHRISAVSTIKDIKYDYLNRRVEERVRQNGISTPVSVRRFAYNGFELIAQWDVTPDLTTKTLAATYGWGLDESGTLGGLGGTGGLLLVDRGSGQQYLPGYDGKGNVTTLLDALTHNSATPSLNIKASFEYGPFGEVLAANGNPDLIPFRWQSKWSLDWGMPANEVIPFTLYDFGMRLYSPNMGRFINRDPLGEGGGLNLYRYAFNNPVHAKDVLGMAPDGVIIKYAKDPDTGEMIGWMYAPGSDIPIGAQIVKSDGTIISATVGGVDNGYAYLIPEATFHVGDTASQAVGGMNSYYSNTDADIPLADNQTLGGGRIDNQFVDPATGAVMSGADVVRRLGQQIAIDTALAVLPVGAVVEWAGAKIAAKVEASMVGRAISKVSSWFKGLWSSSEAAGREANAASASVWQWTIKDACFTAGTLVATSNGATPIEKLRVGDQVLAFNEVTGEQSIREVIEVFERPCNIIVRLHFGGDTLETTAEHPFWVPGTGWVRAGSLVVGNCFQTQSGNPIQLSDIEWSEKSTTVFNIHVRDYHTYYVSKQSVLVHNACTISPAQAAQIVANRAGTLTKIGEDAWLSSGGLKYVGLDKNGLNRVEHVLRHTVAQGPGHSVFSVPRNQVFGLLDEAYASAARVPVPGDPAAFITPMGRTVGTSGENAVRLILRPGTTEVISAYPVKFP